MKIKDTMKRMLISGLMIMGSVSFAHGQIDAINKFFKKYMDDPDFTTVYISGKMFSLMSEIPDDAEDEHIKKQLQDLQGLRILSSSKVDGVALYREVYSKLNGNGYEELMVVREDDQEFKFLVKDEKGVITELLMLSGQDREFFLLSLYGIIDLKTISEISEGMDIDGFEHLDNLNDN